jgi:regulation of enolase protein 1 (concanavalin A-like superfamily)
LSPLNFLIEEIRGGRLKTKQTYSAEFKEQACVFHTKLDKDFAASWTGFSHEAGHGFHGKLDSDFTPSWTVSS